MQTFLQWLYEAISRDDVNTDKYILDVLLYRQMRKQLNELCKAKSIKKN